MVSKVFALPLLISVAFHSLMLAVVLFAWEGSSEPRTVQQPSAVQAQIVEFTPQSQRQAEAEAEAERQRVIDMRERQRQQEAQEAERQRQQEAERQAREREQQAQREREEREQARREQAERERQEAERQRQQEEEAQRQAAERQRSLDDALAGEDEFLQAQQAEVAAQGYTDVISARIENNWSRPPSARLGMQVVLEIQLVPTGRVVDVSIVESSGNTAFDRSAEQAVRRIEQFEEVRDMPSDVFERHFRRLRLVFNPEDLRL